MHRVIAQYTHILPIGLGAMSLSIIGRPSEQEAIRIIIDFLEAGGNFIDTANVYGLDDQDYGHNEKLIAKCLKKLGKSDNILVATKGGASRPNGGWAMRGGEPKQLRYACEQSLINLEIDTHQLYYLHGIDPVVPFVDSLGEIIKLKEEGKIQHIGLANVNMPDLEIAVNLTTISAVQNRCNPFCKGDLKNGLTDFCSNNQIAYIPYCPLGGWADHHTLTKHPLFQPLTMKYDVSIYVLILAWLLEKASHLIPIVGMNELNHFAMNKKALNLSLSSEDQKIFDEFPDLYHPTYIDTV